MRSWQTQTTLTDGTITLRPPADADIDAIHAECQDPEIQRWTGVPSPYHREHAVEYLDKCASDETSRSFLAVDDEGALLGSFAVMELDKAPRYGEIGYWVARDARGKGVAVRAVTLLRDWAAEELGLELVELVIHEDNALSRRVAERAGFLDTGERRPAPRREEPGPPDHAVYAWSAS